MAENELHRIIEECPNCKKFLVCNGVPKEVNNCINYQEGDAVSYLETVTGNDKK